MGVKLEGSKGFLRRAKAGTRAGRRDVEVIISFCVFSWRGREHNNLTKYLVGDRYVTSEREENAPVCVLVLVIQHGYTDIARSEGTCMM